MPIANTSHIHWSIGPAGGAGTRRGFGTGGVLATQEKAGTSKIRKKNVVFTISFIESDI